MQIETYIITPAKLTVYALSALLLCFLCPAASGQNLTVQDSAAFQKSLAESHSDFERINYELELAEYSIRKPGSFKIDLDNASMWINRAKALNARLRSGKANTHILFEKSYLQEEYGTSPKGKAMLLAVIPLLQNDSDKYHLGVAYKALSFYYGLSGEEYNTKVDLIRKAIAAFKQCGDKFKIASTLQYLADLYIIGDSFSRALNTMNESLAVYNSIHFSQIQGLYDLFGTVYSLQADYNSALYYELRAFQISRDLRDSTMQTCEIDNHLGLIMEQLQQLNKAITYFKVAQILAQKHKDINSYFLVSANLADCCNTLSEPKEAIKILDETTGTYNNAPLGDNIKARIYGLYLVALVQLKQFSQAHIYTEKLLGMLNSPTVSTTNYLNAYNELIGYYFATKNYSQELVFLVKYQEQADELGDPSRTLVNLKAWYQLDSAKKDYKAAFYHLLRCKALGDSIFNEKKSQQIAQLQIKNETQQKEDEIRSKSKDIQILTQTAKGAQLTRNVTLAGVMVFILIAGMQYRRYHEKQKINLLITDKNTALQRLVTEKEWLLKEVHHRVKNNLHTVICLLESQAAYLENDALKAVESSQHRIFAMSLIHQRLYQSSDIQTIDMGVYLPEFIMYLKDSFGSPVNINFRQEIEPIRLDVSQAIPLALIVNEAVTNAIKYAFPDDKQGVIKIALLHQDDSIRLIIEDNGIGIPGSIAPDELTSLGLELIRGLTDDLKGEVRFVVKNGTSVVVSFKKTPFNDM